MSNVKERLRSAVDEYASLKAKADELERQLEDTSKAYKAVIRERIPEIMDEIGVTSIKLDDGTTIALRNQCNAAIIDMENAVIFLDGNGFGGIVRTELKLVFVGAERERAVKASKDMAALGYEVEGKTTVHPQTLKSWARERVENGEQLPPDCFSVVPFVEASIKQGKV